MTHEDEYCGVPLSKMTKEELIEAVKNIAGLYEKSLREHSVHINNLSSWKR